MHEYFLGAHLSISKGLESLQVQMDNLGMNCCAFFLKNQRTYNFSPLDVKTIKKFKESIKNPQNLLPHGSYLINLASEDELIREKSKTIFEDDLLRCNQLNIKYYNFHPGSNKNKAEGIKLLANQINETISKIENVTLLIENMAGQGNVLCSKFEEIRQLIDLIKNKERIGVCLDTCHLFGAGYDITTQFKFKSVLQDFDEIVGFDFLKAFHLNDSKQPLGSKKDRHESIGKGLIGEEPFKYLMTNEQFRNLPMILETPDPNLYKSEIQLLKKYENS